MLHQFNLKKKLEKLICVMRRNRITTRMEQGGVINATNMMPEQLHRYFFNDYGDPSFPSYRIMIRLLLL